VQSRGYPAANSYVCDPGNALARKYPTRGELFVTFEEGTWAAWLYHLLKPHVTKVVVCNPRKLAELLRAGLLSAVYHGETGLRTLEELGRSYLAISKDLARTMNRIKALYRSWSIPCGAVLAALR
jgi:hypothetical protein